MNKTISTGPSGDLLVLAEQYGTDKAAHGYTPFYEDLFRKRRQQRLRILEIGVGGDKEPDDPTTGGASLRMWKEYFPNAQILGLDVLDKSGVVEDRIAFACGSQVDEQLLRDLHLQHGPFDIVIDDASHVSALTDETFRILFPLLADDGIYVIEDLGTSYWPMWGGRIRRNARDTTMGFIKNRIDGLNHAEFKLPRFRPSYLDTTIVEIRVRHSIVAFLKGDNRIPSDLNRANPVGVAQWVTEDLSPVIVRALHRPIVVRALDLVGVRGVVATLRRRFAPDAYRMFSRGKPPGR